MDKGFLQGFLESGMTLQTEFAVRPRLEFEFQGVVLGEGKRAYQQSARQNRY